MTLLELHDQHCDGSCRGTTIDQPPAGPVEAGQSGANGHVAPVAGPVDPSAVSPDPWAHLRGLSALEQWNEDANR